MKRRFVTVPYGAYSPDTGGILGAFLSVQWDRPAPERHLEPSNLITTGMISTRGNLRFIGVLRAFALDRLLLYGTLQSVSYTPASFFGIGPDAAYEDEEEFTARRYHTKLFSLLRITPHIYGGLQLMYTYLSMVQREAEGNLVGTYGGDGGHSASLRLLLDAAKKDSYVFPRKGYSLVASFGYNTFTQHNAQREQGFFQLAAEGRLYFPLGKESALAIRGVFQSSSHTPPYFMLPYIGGINMRGYYANRYMDKNMGIVEGEVRVPLFWRLRLAFFTGLAQVAPELKGLFQEQIKFTVGGGFRVVLHKKSGVAFRFDVGFGRDGKPLFYANFGETF